jgi:hypothetical protein
VGNARQRIVFGISVAVLGALVFVVASAYVVDHDYAKVAAAIVGLFAFPVAPVTWHILGERRRTARRAAEKTPPKPSSLSAGDRFWLRFIAVALIVIGPMIVSSRFGVLGSVKRHALWFVPRSEPSLVGLGEGGSRDFKDVATFIARVPAEAELVLVVHQKPDPVQNQKGGSAVLAWGNGQALITADADLGKNESVSDKIDELNDLRSKAPLPIDKLLQISVDEKTVVVASDGWRSKVDPGKGPNADLMRELGRAPQDAPFVVAFVPRTVKDAVSIRAGAAWVTIGEESISIEGRVEAVDAAAATKLVDAATAELHGKLGDIPEKCRDEVGKLVDRVHITATGAIITARAEIPQQALMGLMFCGMSFAK